MQSILPSRFELMQFLNIHIRRDSFQDAESEFIRWPQSEFLVPAMSRFGIVQPPAQQVFLARFVSIRRTDIAFPISAIQDVVNAAPLFEEVLPLSEFA